MKKWGAGLSGGFCGSALSRGLWRSYPGREGPSESSPLLYALTMVIKDEGVTVEPDQVDLAVAGTRVAREDCEAKALKVGGGQSLAEAAKLVAGVLEGCARAGRVLSVRVLAGGVCRGLLGRGG